jgi:hypothetical protein
MVEPTDEAISPHQGAPRLSRAARRAQIGERVASYDSAS